MAFLNQSPRWKVFARSFSPVSYYSSMWMRDRATSPIHGDRISTRLRIREFYCNPGCSSAGPQKTPLKTRIQRVARLHLTNGE
jgi:hypothetical protein